MDDDGAALAGLDVALVRRVTVEELVHDAVAVGVGHELGPVADEAAGRDGELEVGGAAVMGDHVPEFRFPGAEFLDDRADIFARHLDGEEFHRLEELAVLVALVDDLRAGDREFVAFAPHGLDEDGQVEFAAAGDLERIGGLGLFDAHGDVRLDFLEEPVTDVPGGDILAFPSREGGVVDDEVHGDGGFIDLDEFHRFDVLGVAGRLTDVDVGDAGDTDDLAGAGLLDLFTGEAFVDIQL